MSDAGQETGRRLAGAADVLLVIFTLQHFSVGLVALLVYLNVVAAEVFHEGRVFLAVVE